MAKEHWSKDWHPGALLQDPDTARYFNAPLHDLACYFPGVADTETYAYPMPGSEEFWRAYAEPVDDFLRVVFAFADAVRSLAGNGTHGNPTVEEITAVRRAIEFLDALAADTYATFHPGENGHVEPCWRTPSLIGAFARMALLDFARGWIEVCDRCARVFVSSAGRARFCSSRSESVMGVISGSHHTLRTG